MKLTNWLLIVSLVMFHVTYISAMGCEEFEQCLLEQDSETVCVNIFQRNPCCDLPEAHESCPNKATGTTMVTPEPRSHELNETKAHDDCENKFRCVSNHSKCIEHELVLNGVDDCGDNSDETVPCEHQFQCKNDVCIDEDLVDNGVDDCGDGSDESCDPDNGNNNENCIPRGIPQVNGDLEQTNPDIYDGDMLIPGLPGKNKSERFEAYEVENSKLAAGIETRVQLELMSLEQRASIMMDAKFQENMNADIMMAAKRDRKYQWEGAVVYYEMDRRLPYHYRQKIRAAMDEIEQKTCVTFQLRHPSARNYIRIINGRGCYSYVGRQYTTRGAQEVSLSIFGCMEKGIIQHELMHALGFHHEQNRYDRDKYVKVVWSNVPLYAWYNFQAKSKNQITLLGIPYDYGSVMHYPANAFGNGGRQTIRPLQRGVYIGQRRGLSKQDVRKINCYYQCPMPYECDQRNKRNTKDKRPTGLSMLFGTTTLSPLLPLQLACEDRYQDYCTICKYLKKLCNTNEPGFGEWLQRTCKRTCKCG